jgi:hypothetical protein
MARQRGTSRVTISELGSSRRALGSRRSNRVKMMRCGAAVVNEMEF